MVFCFVLFVCFLGLNLLSITFFIFLFIEFQMGRKADWNFFKILPVSAELPRKEKILI